MEELSLGSVLSGDLGLNMVGNGLDEVNGLADQMIPFLDHENASVLLKSVGIMDTNGTFYIDPTQFGNFILDSNNIFPTHLTIQMVPNVSTSTSSSSSKPADVETIMCTPHLPTTSSVPGPAIAAKPISSNASSSTFTSSSQAAIPTSLSNNALPSGGKTSSNNQVMVEPPIGKGPFKCTVCAKVFDRWPQLKRHKTEHLDEKTLRCRICAMTFNYEINLTLHMMVHEAETTGCLQCQICPAKFSRLASLKSHLRVHEKEDNLVCQECGDEFPTKGRLETHLEEHKTRPQQQCILHRCRLCSKNFSQAALLKDHLKEHADFRKELKNIANTRRRKNKPVRADSALESYIKKLKQKELGIVTKPPKKKTRACHLCEKSFEKPSQLARHLRIHTGEKPFVCLKCGKSFNQKGTLESHIQATHDKKKPFVCHLCSCNFSQRGNLKAHVLKVHVPAGENEKVFRCFECSCVYRRLATLNNHIAKAHSVQPQRISSSEPVSIVPATYQHRQDATSSNSKVDPQVSTSFGDGLSLPFSTSLANSGSTSTTLPRLFRTHGAQPSLRFGNPNETTPEIPMSNANANGALPTEASSYEANPNPNESITEVNLAHREQGKPGRCLVKVKKIGQIKWHLCRFCSKSFRKPSDLIRHTRVHTLEKPFTCEVCGKSFAVKSTLNTHLRTHLTVKDLECRVCHKGFSMLSSLKAHERLHTGIKPFQCMQCGKLFRTSAQRRIHLKVHARNANGLSGRRKLLRIGEGTHVELPDPLRITSTGLVPVPNRAVQTLIRNTTQEGRIRPYKCLHCPSGFKKSSHLKQHLRSHTGDRPYKCYQCHRSFVSSGVLKNHIKTHEGVRAFKCTVCNISFTTNGSLTRHRAIHTSARPFVCPYCHKTFKTSVSCRKHIKTHRSEIVQFHSAADGTSNSTPAGPSQQLQIPEPKQLQTSNQTQLYSAGYTQSRTPQTQFSELFSGITSVLSDSGPAPNMTLLPNGTIVSRIQETTLNSATQHTNLSALNAANNANTISGLQCLTPQPATSCTLSNNSNLLQGFTNDAGIVTLQYTVCDTSQRNQMDVANQALFDQTLFSLVRLEQEDLGTPLTYLPDTHDNCANNIMQSQNPSQLNHFDYHDNSVNLPVVLNTSSGTIDQLSDSQVQAVVDNIAAATADQAPESAQMQPPKEATTEAIFHAATTIEKASTARDTDEVRKIRESSRPISERIYNELKAQEHVSKAEVLPNSLPTVDKINECQFCSRAFKKRSDLQRHLRIHTGEKPFRCQVCGKVFRVKSTREAHMRTHIGGKSVSCHMCNNLFATKSSLRVHMRLHTGAKPYQCPHCDRWFRTSGHRKAHIQSHLKQRRDQDAFISEEAANPKDPNLNNVHHQFSSSDSQALVLPPVETIKDKSSSRATISAQHELDNISACLAAAAENASLSGNATDSMHVQLGNVQLTMEGPTIQITGLDLNSLQMDDNFLQNVANVIFIQPQGENDLGGGPQALAVLPDISGDLLDSDITGKDDVSYSQISNSDFCPLTIPGSGDVNINQYVTDASAVLNVDQDSKPCFGKKTPGNKTCKYCGKLFAKPSLLSRHLRVHTGEKPYTCSHCPRTFSQKSSLDAHMYVHSNERPFACPHCPFRTVQRAALRKHYSRAHPNLCTEIPGKEQPQPNPSIAKTLVEPGTSGSGPVLL